MLLLLMVKRTHLSRSGRPQGSNALPGHYHFWLALVTPASFEVGRHLMEGLKNPTVVRDTKALEVFSIRPRGIRDAIQKALASTTA